MAFYETVVVVDPLASEDAFEKHMDRVKEQIESRGGRILKIEEWGKRKLAYSIKHRRDGIYFLVEFEAQGETVAALDQYYRMQESVLRYLTIVREAPSPEGMISPVAMEQGQAEAAEHPVAEPDDSHRDEHENELDDSDVRADNVEDDT
ncbi:30S ribosomal protein S6 [Candidatus Fermentibacteria bacterium]|nr:30S ribosomal protein S6 [Candidatus Fermentibacteria bacterium]